ncbi:MAG: sugar ABC transporter permease [Deinococcus sp.]|nr:sugar ABC transporter permease [Deinococcus sp.]
MLLPALAFFGYFLVYPILFNIYVSFFDWSGLGPVTNFVGLRNYERLLTDHNLRRALFNTFLWVVGMVTVPVALGMAIALMVDGVRGEVFFKSIFFLPYTISFVAIGVMWKWMYYPDYGVVNSILRHLGLGGLARAWLGIPRVNSFAMMAALAWLLTGFAMVIFLAGLRSIPTEIIEAATLDGLSGWKLFRHILFPLLTPFTTLVGAMVLLNTLKVFDVIYVMTGGGPFFSSETIAVTMYRETFLTFRFGYGAAIANFLFVLVVICTIFAIRQGFKREVKY